jgi:iron complex transport system substrate-binding protein
MEERKMRSRLSKLGLICLVAILFSGLFVSCASELETTTPSANTITDQYNRTVTIKANPQRIVSLSPAHTEILYALGLGDRIVGVSEYSDYPPEATAKPSVGSYNEPNIETIISMSPDLVLATEEHEEEVKQLESRGITVVALNPKTINEVLDTITVIGKITGKDNEAADLVESLQGRIDTIAEKTKSLTAEQKPRVFCIIWHDPIWTVGAGTFHDELIRIAGGVNIAGNLNGYVDMSVEALIAADPQIIIAGVGMGEGEDASLVAMQTEDRFRDIDARKTGKIYGANMDIVSRPGPRLADALEVFFNLIHPEIE